MENLNRPWSWSVEGVPSGLSLLLETLGASTFWLAEGSANESFWASSKGSTMGPLTGFTSYPGPTPASFAGSAPTSTPSPKKAIEKRSFFTANIQNFADLGICEFCNIWDFRENYCLRWVSMFCVKGGKSCNYRSVKAYSQIKGFERCVLRFASTSSIPRSGIA